MADMTDVIVAARARDDRVAALAADTLLAAQEGLLERRRWAGHTYVPTRLSYWSGWPTLPYNVSTHPSPVAVREDGVVVRYRYSARDVTDVAGPIAFGTLFAAAIMLIGMPQYWRLLLGAAAVVEAVIVRYMFAHRRILSPADAATAIEELEAMHARLRARYLNASADAPPGSLSP